MTPMVIDSGVLRRLATKDLPAVAGWFQDPDTSRFLGGPDWPAAMLANAERAAGTDFRGARQTAADHFLALANDVPVGCVDCVTAIAFTIDPARRREGLATHATHMRGPSTKLDDHLSSSYG